MRQPPQPRDVLTTAERSAHMSRVRNGGNASTELAIANILSDAGIGGWEERPKDIAVQATPFCGYTDRPLREADDETGDEWERLNAARLRVVEMLARLAGVALADIGPWEEE